MIEARKSQLGDILETLCEQLDISSTQFKDAEKKYNAVGEWLSKPESEISLFNPTIYPQGSFKLGTVVKPLGQDEFDVDVVCEIKIPRTIGQKVVNNIVGKRLAENETYRGMLKPLKRGWRLNYAGNFHMDILPSIPDVSKGNSCILIPDRKLQQWTESNPKGYSKWFKEQMAIAEERRLIGKAEIEQISDQSPFVKTPLQRVVQIFKRYRDIAFFNNDENAPISIVITTLAAKAYNGEIMLYDALINIIEKMPYYIEYVSDVPYVRNPTNLAENFAEKWAGRPELFRIFLDWLRILKSQLETILKTSSSMTRMSETMQPIFGKNLVQKTIAQYADKIETKRRSGFLKTALGTAMLSSKGTTIGRNTFYGTK